MRLYIGLLLALIVAHSASATTLSPEQIQTVLRNDGFDNPGRPPIWRVEQQGDGKAYEPGGIAWWVTVYYPPEALADDICVINGTLIQANDRLLPLNQKARRKIALRSCEGIEPSDFATLNGFEDREMVPAVRVVQSLIRTGAVAGWSVEFSDTKARSVIGNLDAKSLYSISDLFDDSFNPEIYIAFRTSTCGQILWIAVNPVKHTVRAYTDQLDISDKPLNEIWASCKH